MSVKRTRKVLLVDDHEVVRKGLSLLIADDPGLSICGEVCSAAECMALLKKITPDMILTDVSLGSKNGLELIKDIRQMNQNIPILVFSIHDEDLYSERALSAGANGYIMKEADSDSLLKAIHKVLDGEIYLSPAMTNRVLRKLSGNKDPAQHPVTGVDQLSDRELEVFQMIGHGLSTHKIAAKLNLSEKTIETYRAHIKEKFNLEDAAELTRAAVCWVEVGSPSLPCKTTA
jgi:DNA-binding NarL/FixJ family response regulator